MESLAPQRISANMRRFAEHGIDHNNPEHVAAYLLARQTTTRPRPEHILSILKSAKTTSQMGFELCDDYFLVPKGYLTEEEVRALGSYVVSEEQLCEACDLPPRHELERGLDHRRLVPARALGTGHQEHVLSGALGIPRSDGLPPGGERVVCRTWRFSILPPNFVDM